MERKSWRNGEVPTAAAANVLLFVILYLHQIQYNEF
jgi:hypothetical protein